MIYGYLVLLQPTSKKEIFLQFHEPDSYPLFFRNKEQALNYFFPKERLESPDPVSSTTLLVDQIIYTYKLLPVWEWNPDKFVNSLIGIPYKLNHIWGTTGGRYGAKLLKGKKHHWKYALRLPNPYSHPHLMK
jgi:hypothetical protein